MGIIEIIAVLFSLICVILTVKENKLCWLFGIIGTVFYGILFFQNKIWGNMSLQLIFILQSVLGWYNWNKPSKFKIDSLSYSGNVLSIFIVLAILPLIYKLLEVSGGVSPFFDSVTTTLSIMGTVLLAYKKIQAWVFWIIADILFVIFFWQSGLFLSAGIYVVFLILSIRGLLEWRKKLIKK